MWIQNKMNIIKIMVQLPFIISSNSPFASSKFCNIFGWFVAWRTCGSATVFAIMLRQIRSTYCTNIEWIGIEGLHPESSFWFGIFRCALFINHLPCWIFFLQLAFASWCLLNWKWVQGIATIPGILAMRPKYPACSTAYPPILSSPLRMVWCTRSFE